MVSEFVGIPMLLCRNVFLVCPMKSAPVLVRRVEAEDDYTHTSLPTQGEVLYVLTLASDLGN